MTEDQDPMLYGTAEEQAAEQAKIAAFIAQTATELRDARQRAYEREKERPGITIGASGFGGGIVALD